MQVKVIGAILLYLMCSYSYATQCIDIFPGANPFAQDSNLDYDLKENVDCNNTSDCSLESMQDTVNPVISSGGSNLGAFNLANLENQTYNYFSEWRSNRKQVAVKSGTAVVYFDGQGNDIVIPESSRINQNGVPSELIIVVTNGKLIVKKGSTVNAYIYADTEEVKFEENTTFSGAISVTSGKLTIEKDSTYNYVEPADDWDPHGFCNTNPLTIDHYEIEHTGIGLTCEAQNITIKACLNSDCSQLSSDTTTLNFLADGNVISSPTFVGSTVQPLSQTTAKTLTLSISNPTIAPANNTICDSGSSNSCEITFVDAMLRFLYGDGAQESDVIATQTSGAAFGQSLKIQAVENNNGVCTGLFSGDVSINLSQQNATPAGTSGLSFNVNNTSIEKYPLTTPITLNFGNNSIATIPAPLYQDAGEIRLHANYNNAGISLNGVSNAFWVSPSYLSVTATSGTQSLNGNNASATTTHKAGENFSLYVSAYNNQDQLTPNYQPGQLQFKLTRTGPTVHGVNGLLTYVSNSALASALATSTPSYTDVTLPASSSAGVYGSNNANYSEVGTLNLAVRDNQYGFSGNVINASAIDIGRFTPNHFVQTIAQAGAFGSTCSSITPFAYSGQRDLINPAIGAIAYQTLPVLLIEARNKQNNITQNYYQDSEGSSNDFMKLDNTHITITPPVQDSVATGVDGTLLPVSASINTGTISQNDLTVLPLTQALNAGQLHYQISADDRMYYQRSANSLVTPFTSSLDYFVADIVDSDGITATTTNTFSPMGIQIRWARLIVENSFGPETSPLTQPLQVEYFNNGRFVVSNDDNCLTYNESAITLNNISLDPALSGVDGDTGNFTNGRSLALFLLPPGSNNQGELRVIYDTHDWLKYDWNSDGIHQENPEATASFGVYRGSDKVIFWREVLNP